MKLKMLVVSDIHGEMSVLNRINASIHNYNIDLVIICGDITHFGTKEWADSFLDKISKEILGVTGNCDPHSIEEVYERDKSTYLNLNLEEKNGYKFTGLSGNKYSDETLNKFNKYASKADVFVLHSPPYGYLDKTSKGKHIGERGLLSIIDEHQPILVLSGHVHEDRGIIEEEDITYVNPGPAYRDNLAIVSIEDKKVRAKLI